MPNIDQQKMIMQGLLDDLASEGFKVVLAGGACRDWVHGRTAKDFDIFDLNAEQYHGDDQYRDSGDAVARQLARVPDLKVGQVYDTYNEAKGRLMFCIKCVYKEEFDVDYIAYMATPETPREQVEMFDTTLSMGWFASAEGVVVLEPEFVQVLNHETPVRPLPMLDGDVQKRLDYVRSKYPQYKYSLEVLDV